MLPLAILFLLGPAAFGAEWFVDSTRGDDASTGASPDAAFRTISRLRHASIESGDVIHLARDSYWREELRGLPPKVAIRAYGEGARPILDASDRVPDDALQRRVSTYAVLWNHELAELNKVRFSVWEEGLRLRRVASQMEAVATPGSFYAPVPVPGEAAEIWIHPSDGGLHEYEITRREHGLVVPDGGRAEGIHTRRNGHNNGSLVAGLDSLLKDCVAEDGTVHNVLIASGVVEDVTAWKNEIYAEWGSSTMFASYAKSAAGLGVIYRRAKAIGGDPARPGEVGGAVGFYQHVNPGAADYAYLVFESCEASGVAQAFDGIAEHVFIDGGTVTRSLRAVYAQGLVSTYITGLRVDGKDSRVILNRVVEGPSPRTLIFGLDATARISSGALIWLNGEVDIAHSSLAFVTGEPNRKVAVRVDRGVLRVRAVNIDGSDMPIELGADAILR